jgi:hypothetical protein
VGIPPAPSETVERTVLRLPTAPADATIIAPPRRTPPPVPAPTVVPASAPAGPPVAPSAANQPVAKAPVVKEAKPAPAKGAVAAKKAPSLGPIVVNVVVRLKVIVNEASAVVSKVSRDRRALSIFGGVIAVIVAAVVGSTMMLTGPAPTGKVVLDAAPWGTVISIEAEGGGPVSLPSSASTPLVLTLPAGTYQVAIAGPSPESQAQRITVQVHANGSTVAPLVHFRELTAEEYFEQYLSAPTAQTPETGAVATELAAPSALTQPSPVPPPATPIQSSPVPPPAPASKP